MQNVAFILKDLVVGGIQRLLLDLIPVFKSQDRKLIFIAIGKGEQFETFKNAGVPFFFIPKKLPFFDPILVFRIRKLLLKHKIEIIHSHHVSEAISAHFAIIGTSVKHVLSYHVGLQLNNSQDSIVFKKLHKRVDRAVCPSNAFLNEMKSAGYDSSLFTVVPNGIDTARLLEKPTQNIRNKFNIQEDDFVIGMIGNFYNNTRNQIVVCKAFELLEKKYEHLRLIFYGGHSNSYLPDAEHYKQCYDFCEKNELLEKVFFAGIETDTTSALASLDLFAYASLNDTFGIAVAESILSIKPTLVNDLDVFKELTQNGKYAELYPTNNHEVLAQKIENFILKKSRKPDERLIEEFKNKYSIESHFHKLDEVYKSLF
ncbi:MAG: glycosyltransferase [Chitinophagaceae bacterium]|nr:MAG: glycosyltransferase [Chitinophagaceae bacterium]